MRGIEQRIYRLEKLKAREKGEDPERELEQEILDACLIEPGFVLSALRMAAAEDDGDSEAFAIHSAEVERGLGEIESRVLEGRT